MRLTIALLLTCFYSFAAEPKIDPGTVEYLWKFCFDCHDSEIQKADLNIEKMLDADLIQYQAKWEKVLRNIEARRMPPLKKKRRPTVEQFKDMQSSLTHTLDLVAASHGEVHAEIPIRRITRTEYKNSIRDLLGLDLDVSTLLPADSVSHGFDNITVSDLSPALMERYIGAARKISRLAVGVNYARPQGYTIRAPADVTQSGHVEGLPLGTRGGMLMKYNFPQDGEYVIQVHLARDRDEYVEGIVGTGKHRMVILIDNKLQKSFEIVENADHSKIDKHLQVRVNVKAGEHKVGATFVNKGRKIIEQIHQPYVARINKFRSPRQAPAVFQVSILGPLNGRAGNTSLSRQMVFGEYLDRTGNDHQAAQGILKSLMRKAFRRPVSKEQLARVMTFYKQSRESGGNFEQAIETALAAVLVSRSFLFKVSSGKAAATDFEFAERLSFFLWSSLPDDELLDLAEQGKLKKPEVLQEQLSRMLKDKRSFALVENFSSQWLYLRNVKKISPDARLFPDFDDNLRQAFRQETELLVADVLRNNKSALDLIKSDFTYLNERLAKHYDIPNIYGSRFRKVQLKPEYNRGGILRHGSILSVTSYANRTSPVIRGHWILENLLGVKTPPPPPNVETFTAEQEAEKVTFREKLAKHRENSSCASCHDSMDPIGFSLESFDAIGRWRELEGEVAIDQTGGFVDGTKFNGVEGLENAIMERPEIFVTALTEKLFTYALGRGIEPVDRSTVRQIVRQSQKTDYSIHSLLAGIISSQLFNQKDN